MKMLTGDKLINQWKKEGIENPDYSWTLHLLFHHGKVKDKDVCTLKRCPARFKHK